MRILNFGSLNIDEIYRVADFVHPGETVRTQSRTIVAGGKGLNQSIALARAGASVTHAGCIGTDGAFLAETLAENGVDISLLRTTDIPTGRAVIQVSDSGQNAILHYPGANLDVDKEYIRKIFANFGPSDWVLLQNEISCVGEIMEIAASRGMHIVFNPSPITKSIDSLPLGVVSCFHLNEHEGAALSGTTVPEDMLAVLRERFPRAQFVLTLGDAGAYFAGKEETFFCEACPATPVDTTGAGDTFTGFLVAAVTSGKTPREAMAIASQAAALSITKQGSSASIPTMEEVQKAMQVS